MLDDIAYPIRKTWRLITLIAFSLLSCHSLADSSPLSGEKTIYLLDKQGTPHQIGSVHFKKKGDYSHYQLHMDHDQFVDYFLSMKEMKCLEGPELWCHLPYPYKQPRTVTHQDLRWLSHDLLFMFKQKNTFGANFWNGIY